MGRGVYGSKGLPVPRRGPPGFGISLPRCGAEEKEGVVRVKNCKLSNIRKMELGSLLFAPDV